MKRLAGDVAQILKFYPLPAFHCRRLVRGKLQTTSPANATKETKGKWTGESIHQNSKGQSLV